MFGGFFWGGDFGDNRKRSLLWGLWGLWVIWGIPQSEAEIPRAKRPSPEQRGNPQSEAVIPKATRKSPEQSGSPQSDAEIPRATLYTAKKSEPPEWEAPKRFDYSYKLLSRLTYRNCADSCIVRIIDGNCNTVISYYH